MRSDQFSADVVSLFLTAVFSPASIARGVQPSFQVLGVHELAAGEVEEHRVLLHACKQGRVHDALSTTSRKAHAQQRARKGNVGKRVRTRDCKQIDKSKSSTSRLNEADRDTNVKKMSRAHRPLLQ